MIKAFVFGKFLPFHKGHEAMINFALNTCDFLSVLVCCSDKEEISSSIRKKWIENAFFGIPKIEIREYTYFESELPNTSESSEEVSKIWATIFRQQFPEYSIIISSEEYGYFVAKYMTIKHIAFDIPKQIFPISASTIKKNGYANWNYLPKSVKPYFSIKVVLLGTESTGKTTLTQKLSSYFNCSQVEESARDIIANSKAFSFSDLERVAKEHSLRITNSCSGESRLVIIDTNVYTTISYSRFVFGQELDLEEDIYATNTANLYLYLDKEIEFVQDGTRLTEDERNLLDFSHRQVLRENSIDFIEISGTWQERFEQVIEQINLLVNATKTF
ncbi:MAG: cytidyltransferase [Bacteroidetes bacterium B1(2017)]|nr:MAG: cytidyltransferase [Bacteroidetes bacterium B1(2017)]